MLSKLDAAPAHKLSINFITHFTHSTEHSALSVCETKGRLIEWRVEESDCEF